MDEPLAELLEPLFPLPPPLPAVAGCLLEESDVVAEVLPDDADVSAVFFSVDFSAPLSDFGLEPLPDFLSARLSLR